MKLQCTCGVVLTDDEDRGFFVFQKDAGQIDSHDSLVDECSFSLWVCHACGNLHKEVGRSWKVVHFGVIDPIKGPHGGGVVKGGNVSLIGEKGPEFVAPNRG